MDVKVSNTRWRSLDVQFSGCKRELKTQIDSGGYGEGEPPVPIPNTEVKPFSADGTWLATARESKTLPDPKKKNRIRDERFFFCFGCVGVGGRLHRVWVPRGWVTVFTGFGLRPNPKGPGGIAISPLRSLLFSHYPLKTLGLRFDRRRSRLRSGGKRLRRARGYALTGDSTSHELRSVSGYGRATKDFVAPEATPPRGIRPCTLRTRSRLRPYG